MALLEPLLRDEDRARLEILCLVDDERVRKSSRLRWSQRRFREPMVSIITDIELASPMTAGIPFRMRLPCVNVSLELFEQ